MPTQLVLENRQRFVQLEREDINVIMQLVDKDHDGIVSVDDFRSFVNDLLSGAPSQMMK
jgi:Ca2+-binding EF-hand superfamily protein